MATILGSVWCNRKGSWGWSLTVNGKQVAGSSGYGSLTRANDAMVAACAKYLPAPVVVPAAN